MDDAEVRERIAALEPLLGALEDEPRALAALEALVGLYGEALRRLLDGADPVGDEIVSHLLVLHGLHPDDVTARVERALDEVRPYLRSHGGGVELVEIADGVVRLRLEGTCDGCPSSAATMTLAIEEAVQRSAPEIDRVEADGAVPSPAPLLQLGGVAPRGGAWEVAGALGELRGGGALREIGGTPVLFVGIDDGLYAYRNPCPACGSSLEHARLDGAEIVCPACSRRFDGRRAGRCLDLPQLSLEPVPLLVGDGDVVKVAVA